LVKTAVPNGNRSNSNGRIKMVKRECRSEKSRNMLGKPRIAQHRLLVEMNPRHGVVDDVEDGWTLLREEVDMLSCAGLHR
jgi:hypothetical protein